MKTRKPQAPLAALKTIRKLISDMEVRYIMIDGEQTLDNWIVACIKHDRRVRKPRKQPRCF